jgi:indole-3-glycerol phosphate synthase
VSKNFLSEIIEQKKKDLRQGKTFFSYCRLRLLSKVSHPLRPFRENISRLGKLNLIAEIKQASPSRGLIRQDFDAQKIARIYEEAGAAAISVLTEEHFFKGELASLNRIRKTTATPILRKDFIIDEFQIYESYVYGADAILLIARILEEKKLRDFIALAHKLGLDCLVEVHDVEDLKKALSAGSRIIGINNRDLNSFQTDLKTTARLRPLIPGDKIVVSESGIKDPEDIRELKGLGLNAVWIGEAFLDSSDISQKIRSLMQG